MQAQISAQRLMICVMGVAWFGLQASGQTAHSWGHPRDVLIRYHHRTGDSTRLQGPFEASCAGRPWLEGHFEDSRKEGEWTTYHLETGQPLAHGTFAAGRPVGEWTFGYPDGRIRATGRFDPQGAHEGIWTSYHAGSVDERRVWAEWGDEHLHVMSAAGDTLLSRRLIGEDKMTERTFATGGRLLREVTYKWFASPSANIDTSPRGRLLVPPAEERLFVSGFAGDEEGHWVPWGSIRRYSVYGAMMEHLVWRGDTLLQVVASHDAFGKSAETPRTQWDPLRGSGVLVRRHSDGSVAAEVEYEDNLRHGAFTKRLPNGRILVAGLFHHGRATGTWQMNEITGRLAVTASPDDAGCWTGQAWGLSGRQTERFRTCGGWADGEQVTFDAYGDTAEVSTWAMGLLSGPFRAYRRGELFLQGAHSDQTRSTTWSTFNPRGQVTHESHYDEAPRGWDRQAWPPPRNRPGPLLSLMAGQDDGPGETAWPWGWRSSPSGAAGFDENVGLRESADGLGWDLGWQINDGAVAHIVEWDVTGHVIGLQCLFSERRDLRHLAESGLQRMLVVRPETRFGFPMPGADLVGLQQSPQSQ